MSTADALQEPGSGAKLLDALRINGTGEDKLRPARVFLEQRPGATAAEVIRALEASGAQATTISKAQELVLELNKPLSLNSIAVRLKNVASFTDSDYRAKFLESVPEWPLVRHACERLFRTSGQVRHEDVRRLVDALRFEVGIERAGETPLSDIVPQIKALLRHDKSGGIDTPKGTRRFKNTLGGANVTALIDSITTAWDRLRRDRENHLQEHEKASNDHFFALTRLLQALAQVPLLDPNWLLCLMPSTPEKALGLRIITSLIQTRQLDEAIKLLESATRLKCDGEVIRWLEDEFDRELCAALLQETEQSPDNSELIAPLWAYRQPPGGLSPEWETTFRALVDPVSRVAAIYGIPGGVDRGTRGLYEAWYDTLTQSEIEESAVLPYLHGRAPRTWRIGHVIREAVASIRGALWPARDYDVPGGDAEAAAAVRANLRELGEFDAASLFDQLADAVTSECHLPLSLAPQPSQPDWAAQGEVNDARATTIDAPETTGGRFNTRQELLEYLDHNGELPLDSDPTLLPEGSPHWWERFIWDLYSDMHRLGILWTPAPPYKRLTRREAEDEYRRIRAQLRAEIGGSPRDAPSDQYRGGRGDKWKLVETIQRFINRALPSGVLDKQTLDEFTDATDRIVAHCDQYGAPFSVTPLVDFKERVLEGLRGANKHGQPWQPASEDCKAAHMADVLCNRIKGWLVATKQPETSSTPAKKPKCSTERGEGRAKIIAALAKYHQYEHGSCLNTEPVVANELARIAEVGKGTVNRFFNDAFNDGEKGGYAKYKRACCDRGKLVHAFKLLLGEVTPSILFKPLSNVNEIEDSDE